MKHLILHVEAPLMSFGGETVDNYGFIRRFPSASMITGLLANALGWCRIEKELHQQLQDRLIFAARIDREPSSTTPLRDFQTAQLMGNEKGWTTTGQPEGRAGGAKTFDSPHLRYRDYWADMCVTIAMRLGSNSKRPDLTEVGHALIQPARPLFIGRQPCLPTALLFAGYEEGETCLAALLNTPIDWSENTNEMISLLWPQGEGVVECRSDREYRMTDQRNWISGLHGGARIVCEGSCRRDEFPKYEVAT